MARARARAVQTGGDGDSVSCGIAVVAPTASDPGAMAWGTVLPGSGMDVPPGLQAVYGGGPPTTFDLMNYTTTFPPSGGEAQIPFILPSIHTGGGKRRKSPKLKSQKRKSPKRSQKRKSPKRESPKRKSPKRKSPKRKSPKCKSPKRKSPKRKSPKRK